MPHRPPIRAKLHAVCEFEAAAIGIVRCRHIVHGIAVLPDFQAGQKQGRKPYWQQFTARTAAAGRKTFDHSFAWVRDGIRGAA
jgi:hypothetical protein